MVYFSDINNMADKAKRSYAKYYSLKELSQSNLEVQFFDGSANRIRLDNIIITDKDEKKSALGVLGNSFQNIAELHKLNEEADRQQAEKEKDKLEKLEKQKAAALAATKKKANPLARDDSQETKPLHGILESSKKEAVQSKNKQGVGYKKLPDDMGTNLKLLEEMKNDGFTQYSNNDFIKDKLSAGFITFRKEDEAGNVTKTPKSFRFAAVTQKQEFMAKLTAELTPAKDMRKEGRTDPYEYLAMVKAAGATEFGGDLKAKSNSYGYAGFLVATQFYGKDEKGKELSLKRTLTFDTKDEAEKFAEHIKNDLKKYTGVSRYK